MANSVDCAVNPANTGQQYVLYGNGVIEARGGAIPVEQVEFSINQAYTDKAPMWSTGFLAARRIQVINWTTPSGYTLDAYGLVYPWGGAAHVPGANPPLTTGPEFLFGTNGGFPNQQYGWVNDFYMDPGNTGRGYFLQYDGDVIGIGTGFVPITHGAFLFGSGRVAMRLRMDWTSKRNWILDNKGCIHYYGGSSTMTIGSAASFGGVQDSQTLVWGRDGVDFRLYDMSSLDGALGWMMDCFGRIYPINGAEDPKGFYFTPEYPGWSSLGILNSGVGAPALQLLQMTRDSGSMYWFTSSTAPTVAVYEPAEGSTVTNSTRPFLGWNYSDAEGDAASYFFVRVFTAAQYGIGGFDPATSPCTYEYLSGYFNVHDPNLRRLRTGVDLANGTYRVYVRAGDVSQLTSAWDFNQWTQSVTLPATPSAPAVSVDPAKPYALKLTLAVNPTGLSAQARLLVQYHDSDWNGTTWETVRGGDAVDPDASGNAILYDPEPRFGITRTYRNATYIYSATGDAWIAGLFSSTSTGTLNIGNVWAFGNVFTNTTISCKVQEFAPSRSKNTGVFWPVHNGSGVAYPIILSDGPPKAATFQLHLWSFTKAERLSIEQFFDADIVLLLRDPFGRAYFVVQTGELNQPLLRATPLLSETTAVRDAQDISVDVQQVARPDPGPFVGPFAD